MTARRPAPSIAGNDEQPPLLRSLTPSDSGWLTTVMLKAFSAAAVPSTALTVNVYAPAVVGLPVIAPVDELRFSPDGRFPEITDHVAPETLASRLAVYGSFTVPEGRLVVVIVIVAGGVALMVMVNCFDALSWPASVAVTVKVAVPAVVGVPEIVPVVGLSVRPDGRVPDDTCHVAPGRFAARVAV